VELLEFALILSAVEPIQSTLLTMLVAKLTLEAMPTTTAKWMALASPVPLMISAMPLMEDVFLNNPDAINLLVSVLHARPMLTAQLLLPIVEVMVFAMIAVSMETNVELDLTVPQPPPTLTPTVTLRLVFVWTSALLMRTVLTHACLAANSIVGAVWNVILTVTALLPNGEELKEKPRPTVIPLTVIFAHLLIIVHPFVPQMLTVLGSRRPVLTLNKSVLSVSSTHTAEVQPLLVPPTYRSVCNVCKPSIVLITPLMFLVVMHKPCVTLQPIFVRL
jgi:hypothetical protein